MLRTGEWLGPSGPEGELTRKPPLYYWIAASALTALPGRPELAARLPSAILGTLGVLVTWAAARARFGGEVALLAALILATSGEWTRAATVARVDMALAAGLPIVLGAWVVVLGDERQSRSGVSVFGRLGWDVDTLCSG